jgi:8-oxo-dGTP diphosphatase
MKITRVAAAIMFRSDVEFLLAQRPAGKPYPGYWEFPGGKIEAGETALEALSRELKEELDVEVIEATPWVTRTHVYTHATVHLSFFRVTRWQGEPRGLEGQAHVWQTVDQLSVGPMLPANTPIFRSLALPTVMRVSNIEGMGEAAWLQSLRSDTAALVQLREKSWCGDDERIMAMVESIATRNTATSGPQHPCVINSDMLATPAALGRIWSQNVGLHMTSAMLATATARPTYLTALAWWGASCHSRAEIERANAIGCDYAVLGPVKPTPSHPGAPGIGWDAFREWKADSAIPVFAIGGMNADDKAASRAAGAHGVACKRWRTVP